MVHYYNWKCLLKVFKIIFKPDFICILTYIYQTLSCCITAGAEGIVNAKLVPKLVDKLRTEHEEIKVITVVDQLSKTLRKCLSCP